MNNHPLISIVVPCYNQAHFLDECLNSVLNQTYSNWECIVVNDGSKDDTDKIVVAWTKKDNRYKYIKKINGGLSSARNAGIDIVKGSYILFLDSDDILLPEKLEKSIEALSVENTDVVLTNFLRIKGTSKRKKRAHCILKHEYFTYENILLKWDTEFTFPPHCILVRKNFIEEIRFNEKLKAKEDWIMWLAIFNQNPKVSFLDEVLVYYRLHKGNMTKKQNHMLFNEKKAYMEIYNTIDNENKQKFLEKIFQDTSNQIQYQSKKTNKYKKLFKIALIVSLFLALVIISIL